MTILSLTLFRRREEPDRTDREDPSTRGDNVLNRLEQMLVVDTVSPEQIEENEVNEKTRSDAGADRAAANPPSVGRGDMSAAPETTASNVVSAVALLTPADEIEVEPLSVPAPIDEDTAEALASLGLESAAANLAKWTQEDTDDRLTIALDEAQAEAVARQLVEQERSRLQEDTRRQVERLEQELADAYERLQTEVVLRRAAEVELDRLREENSSRVAEGEARLAALTADVALAAEEPGVSQRAAATKRQATKRATTARAATKRTATKRARKPAAPRRAKS